MKDDILENNISISKFLSRYLGFEGKCMSKVTHEEIKILFPYLKRSSFDEIKKNPRLIYSGEVVLVNDTRNTIPYYVPKVLDEEREQIEYLREEVKKRGVDYSRHDYCNMSIFELKQLLERKFNSTRNQKGARKELNKRGELLKRKYKRNKIFEEE